MGTLNLALGGTTAVPENANPAVFKLTRVIDATVNNLTAADVVECINVPKNTRVLAVAIETLTVGGATCTCTVGDADDADGYITSHNLNSAAAFSCSTLALTEATPNTVTGYSGGKTYTAADTIDVVMGHTNAKTKFKVSVVCVPF